MTQSKPELIEIIEGPTPEFIPSPQVWLESLLESPDEREAAMVQLRTMNGESIMERCLSAWDENRPVRLDFPDQLRMRQQVDVVAMRLSEIDEGPLLTLWVSLPVEFDGDEDGDLDELEDDFDDDIDEEFDDGFDDS